MRAELSQIEYHLPATVVTNEMLAAENPSWEIEKVVQRSGVRSRHIAAENETALDLAAAACAKLFAARPEIREEIQALVFCSQSQDYIMPPNACLLHQRLDLKEGVFAFDFNSACAGFVHGLALADGLIRSGRYRNLLLINADTYSKFTHPKDRSTRVLFGDGAAATWLTATDQPRGIRDCLCATQGKLHDKFIISAGGCRLPKSEETAREIARDKGAVTTQEHICMDGMGILTFVATKVPEQLNELLRRNEWKLEDVDLFLFHQASKMALDALARALRIDPGRVFSNISEIGNTVSASLPIAMKDAQTQGLLRPGSKVVACGFGVGLTWASALIEL